MLHALGPDVGIDAGNNKNALQLTNKQVALGVKDRRATISPAGSFWQISVDSEGGKLCLPLFSRDLVRDLECAGTCSSKPTLPSWQRAQSLLAKQAMLNFAHPK